MATARQIEWRKTFAKRYGKKKSAKARTSARPPKKVITMARRRSRRSFPRRVARAATRRVYRRRSHEFILPAVDIATGIGFLDGACGPGKRASATLINLGAGAVGAKGYSINNGIDHATIGATQFMSDPVNGVINGIKGVAPVLAYKFIAKKIGIPKSVRVFKGFRVQVR